MATYSYVSHDRLHHLEYYVMFRVTMENENKTKLTNA